MNATHDLLAGRIGLRAWVEILVPYVKTAHQKAALRASEGEALSPAITQQIQAYTQDALKQLRELALQFQQSPNFPTDKHQEFCDAVSDCLNLERCTYENVRVLKDRENGAQLVQRILPGGGCTAECHLEAAKGRLPISQFVPLNKGNCGCVLVTTYRSAPVYSTPAVAVKNRDKNVCSDCGKRMGTLEKLANSIEGDNRCAECDKIFKDEQARLQREEDVRIRALAIAEEQRQQAQRQTALQSILDGNLPVVSAPIVMKKNEVCHHSVQAAILEERVVDRVRVGQSASVSFRVCKGVRYRVGGSRGRMVAITGVVQVDVGELHITNQRCVFDGRGKSFSIPHKKLISFEPANDGLQLNPENKKSIVFQLEDGELAAVILSTILNNADL
jgi:hypothetical protein